MKDFLNALASPEPVPGGGSVSALCGALAAALAQMVASLTVGRKKYADVSPEMSAIIGRVEPLRIKLTELIDLDAQAYAGVMAAYRLPKETEGERYVRDESIREATRHAAEVPMTVARTVAQLLPDITRVAEAGNRNAITDACVAAMCAHTAIRGALLNVQVNLPSVGDPEFVAEYQEETACLLSLSASAEHNVLSKFV